MGRYSRQELYENIGKKGQQALNNKHILIVGIGALGTVASELLVRAGIGKIVLIDRDFIELDNLQRQSLFKENDVGKLKTEVVKEKLSKINSDVKVESKVLDLNYQNIDKIKTPDVILGCTDNMESRFLLNDYTLKNKIPYIYGAAVSDKGFVFNVIPGNTCLRCIFKGKTEETCDSVGILNSNSHIIASLMTNEAIKILLGKKYEKNLIHIDIWKNEFLKIKVKQNNSCQSCSGNYEYLNGKIFTETIKLCGKNSYQIKTKNQNLDYIEKKFKGIRFKGVFHTKEFTVFKDGRILIKAKTSEKAKIIFEKNFGN